MKIRAAFVSNSSSSSFCCIIDSSIVEELKKELDAEQEKVFNLYFHKDKVFEKDCLVMVDHIYEDDFESEEEMNAFNNLMFKLRKTDRKFVFFKETT